MELRQDEKLLLEGLLAKAWYKAPHELYKEIWVDWSEPVEKFYCIYGIRFKNFESVYFGTKELEHQLKDTNLSLEKYPFNITNYDTINGKHLPKGEYFLEIHIRGLGTKDEWEREKSQRW